MELQPSWSTLPSRRYFWGSQGLPWFLIVCYLCSLLPTSELFSWVLVENCHWLPNQICLLFCRLQSKKALHIHIFVRLSWCWRWLSSHNTDKLRIAFQWGKIFNCLGTHIRMCWHRWLRESLRAFIALIRLDCPSSSFPLSFLVSSWQESFPPLQPTIENNIT